MAYFLNALSMSENKKEMLHMYFNKNTGGLLGEAVNIKMTTNFGGNEDALTLSLSSRASGLHA